MEEDKQMDYVITRWISGHDVPDFEDFRGTIEEAISYILTLDYGYETTGQIREVHICDTNGGILCSNKLKAKKI